MIWKVICNQFSIDVEKLINQVMQSSITINFHPDRLSNNGKTVIENLLEQGQYHGQFRTGTTNGGKTAFVGGDRFMWEQCLFHSPYPDNSFDRPKYGALNIFKYIDGASVRFGSCYLVLKKDVKVIGRNLDYCIETHIHGDVHLEDDVDSFYIAAEWRLLWI